MCLVLPLIVCSKLDHTSFPLSASECIKAFLTRESTSIALQESLYPIHTSLKPASFEFSLHPLGNKSEVTPNVYQSSFNEFVSQYSHFHGWISDWGAVGAAAIVGSQVSKKRLPNGSSIFSAEARRLLMALGMVHQSADRPLLFLSDSLSCLQSLKNRDLSHPVIADILCRVHILSRGTQVAFMWVPSHVGLAGNSAADIAAKAALLLPISGTDLGGGGVEAAAPPRRRWGSRPLCREREKGKKEKEGRGRKGVKR